MEESRNTKYIENKNGRNFVIVLLIILFIYNDINFIRLEGNTLPIPAALSNLIIILALVVLLQLKHKISGPILIQ